MSANRGARTAWAAVVSVGAVREAKTKPGASWRVWWHAGGVGRVLAERRAVRGGAATDRRCGPARSRAPRPGPREPTSPHPRPGAMRPPGPAVVAKFASTVAGLKLKRTRWSAAGLWRASDRRSGSEEQNGGGDPADGGAPGHPRPSATAKEEPLNSHECHYARRPVDESVLHVAPSSLLPWMVMSAERSGTRASATQLPIGLSAPRAASERHLPQPWRRVARDAPAPFDAALGVRRVRCP